MRQRESELQALDIRPAVVTFQAGPVVEAYVRETNLDWPILLNPDLSLYRAYGMERGGIWAVWGPQNWGEYFRIMAKGQLPRAPAGDTLQLGGDVLVDPLGVVRLHHVGRGPADRPSVDSLLDVRKGV